MGFINTVLLDCRNWFSENWWSPKDTFVNPLKLRQFTILKKADEKMELLEQDIKTYIHE